ncbi:MAG: ribonuclease P protein component [Oscillospiraceae bacterium]|nr:ribonuclease P protein component [Oscillospiraceae bacterium]
MTTQTIRENYIFRRLYRQGKSVVSPCVVLYYKKTKGNLPNRLGITATKKIGKAVSRNRARRVIRESYRCLEPRLSSGYDFVIVARTRAAGVKMQVVKAELEGLLKSIGGIKSSKP